jgi:hypothetical protein
MKANTQHPHVFIFAVILLILVQCYSVYGFTLTSIHNNNNNNNNKPTFFHGNSYCLQPSKTRLFSTSEKKRPSLETKEEDEVDNEFQLEDEDDFDNTSLDELSEEFEEQQDGETDEMEFLAAIDEAPVGSLSLDQISFLRDIMSYFVSDEISPETQDDAKTAPVVERLLFRLLDEWQDAIASEEKEEKALALQPTIADFTLVMKAWEQETLAYSSSRRRDAGSQEAISRSLNLFGILQELWEEGGIETLKPNEEILEIVLRVMASSRERGMDRQVWSIFESVRDRQIYGFGPTCDMYQSVIVSLARSRSKGSPQRAETILREAVKKFPPHIDTTTELPGGIPLGTFNKVLVSWAKSGEEDGPERAEKLIVFMDELDRDLDCGGIIKPDLSSFTTLIDAYAQQNNWEGISYSERIFNRLLDHYLEGEIEDEPNIASWTIVISAWTRLAKKNFRGAEEKAAHLLKRMEALHQDGRISFGPDAIAYVACMNAWAFSKNRIGPTQAELILDEMHEKFMDGDDSMKPSARSIQIVIDSWVKMDDRECMEQAELVLDRYEDHLDTLGPPDGPPEELIAIADIYKIMLFGWSKYDPERAQDYLLDMVDREMKLESFSLDKIIEANTQLLPDDPNAMDRIQEVVEVMEKCRQNGMVKPNERVYTSYIRAMTKARTQDLANRALSILQRMKDSYEEGNKGIRPTVFTYNAVLNACAETINIDESKPMEAFKIALEVFNELRRQKGGLDHVTFGNLLKCSNLLPDGPQKDKFISTTFKLCCSKGLVNFFVVRDLQGAASEELWRSLVGCPEGEVDMEMLPRQWSAAATRKKNMAKKPFRRF